MKKRVIINENNITFGSPVQDGKVSWQDILFEGDVIGSLASKNEGFLLPAMEWYQLLMPEKDKYKKQADDWGLSEDDGFIFVVFWTIEKFIKFYNEECN